MPWQYNQGRNDKYWWELKKKGGLHHSLKAGCSNKQIYAQLIDDLTGNTLASASSYKNKSVEKVNKIDQAGIVGKEIAEKAKKVGIENVVFDRNGYLYHGRVKSLANSAREAGLKF